MEIIYFLIAFLVCLMGNVFHTAMHFAEHKDKRASMPKMVERIMLITIYLGFVAYGLMIYLDPVGIGLPRAVTLPSGLLLGTAGLALFMSTLSSPIVKKGFVETEQLYTNGIYSMVRNPMYLGAMLLTLGIPLVFNSMLTLISSAIWIPMLFIWKRTEEEDLEKRFGEEYLEYKKRTFF